MACAATILPPIELIPICWVLELVSSALLVRGGWKDADKRVITALFIGSAIGTPIGIYLTTSLDVTTSTMIALVLVCTLATLQLAKIQMPFLATKPGLYGTGLTAGIVTGLASIGGMVVALYVLAQQKPARIMRASLILFLFLGSITSLVTYLAFGVMDETAAYRGLIFILPTVAGVLIGTRSFTPSLEKYYKPFCLTLLVGLASLGLARLAM
jgi:uncharacterized membrane protein YfcA